MIEKILEGLAWGLFFVAAVVPVAAFSVAWSWLWPLLRKSKETEIELLAKLFEDQPEEPPELPEESPELPIDEDMPPYRFTASTIVRPPKVIRKADVEDDD